MVSKMTTVIRANDARCHHETTAATSTRDSNDDLDTRWWQWSYDSTTTPRFEVEGKGTTDDKKKMDEDEVQLVIHTGE
jgi:hypothetical protein